MTTRSFDIGTAIFYFFKRFGENPGGALKIAFSQLVLAAILVAGALVFMMPIWTGVAELVILEESGRLTDEMAVRHVFGVLGSSFFLIVLSIPVGIAAALMFQAAWLRFLTKGEVKPGIPFRLGGDEMRLLGVNLLYIAIAVVAYLAVALVFVMSALGAALIFKGGSESIGAALGAGLLVLLVGLAIAIVLLVIAVRLASAPGLTVLEGRMRFFESWGATKGVFWPMLVSYLVVGVLVMVISSVIGFMVQILLIGAMLPFIVELVALEESGALIEAEQVFEALSTGLSNPLAVAAVVLAFLVAYASQLVLEGMWNGVGAYNAVRAVGDDDGRDLGAPVLDKDHPVGASPSEG